MFSNHYMLHSYFFFFFFFNDTATTEIYTRKDTLSLHDALPISAAHLRPGAARPRVRLRGRALRRARQARRARHPPRARALGRHAGERAGRARHYARPGLAARPPRDRPS